jgi:hypothetical protein
VAGTNPAGLDVATPSIARMYDYFLDGKDNFPADRDAAEKLIAICRSFRARTPGPT